VVCCLENSTVLDIHSGRLAMTVPEELVVKDVSLRIVAGQRTANLLRIRSHIDQMRPLAQMEWHPTRGPESAPTEFAGLINDPSLLEQTGEADKTRI
jgi:hypothetical protein